MVDYSDLLIRIALNLGSMIVLLFFIYYPRYSNKETTISAALINVFSFSVLSMLSAVQFSVAAGFGLFAILALFTLRSEPISKSDISYFFGSISLSVIASVQGTDFGFIILMLLVVLLAVYIVDHPRILHSSSVSRLTLDYIPNNVLGNSNNLKEELSGKLGVGVISVRVISIDYVAEVVKVEIGFRV